VRYIAPTPAELDSRTEYDMDDQDEAWLILMNEDRLRAGHEPVPLAALELVLDRCEKEWLQQYRVRPRWMSTQGTDRPRH